MSWDVGDDLGGVFVLETSGEFLIDFV